MRGKPSHPEVVGRSRCASLADFTNRPAVGILTGMFGSLVRQIHPDARRSKPTRATYPLHPVERSPSFDRDHPVYRAPYECKGDHTDETMALEGVDRLGLRLTLSVGLANRREAKMGLDRGV